MDAVFQEKDSLTVTSISKQVKHMKYACLFLEKKYIACMTQVLLFQSKNLYIKNENEWAQIIIAMSTN